VGEALASLGVFVGGDEIALRRVTPHRLRAELARALQVPASLRRSRVFEPSASS
jgi:hypothetical protein